MSSAKPAPMRTKRVLDRSDKTAAVLSVLRRYPTVTVSNLVQETGFSRPTVTSILEDMRAANLAQESQLNDPLVGRPAGSWTLKTDAGTVIAVDILPASLLLAAADLRGEVIFTDQQPLSHHDAQTRLQAVIAAITKARTQIKAHGAVQQLCVSATGKINAAGTIVASDLVPVWNNYPLQKHLSDALKIPTTVENDINMAALGEFANRRQDGRIEPAGDMLFVQLARGLHTGLILAGKIHRGHDFNAGEIADFLDLSLNDHTKVTDDWVKRACLMIASVGAVVDPDAIVISSPSPASRSTVSRVANAMSTIKRPAIASFAAEIGDLGWAASCVGALHMALQYADSALTGAVNPRPAALRGINLIHEQLQKGKHTTMTNTLAPINFETLRVGIVGVGARSRFALAAELPENNGRITAVCDPHPLVRERVRTRLKREPDTVKITARVEDLIATGIDVAFVTSPDDTHADITCALLEAGIPVYLEKPLAIDLDDATRVLQTAQRTGTRLYVGHNMRHMHVVRSMRDLVLSGRIGEVKAIWCRHFVGHGGDYYFRDWHAERKHANTLLLQKAAHDIDVMHWIANSHTTDVVAMGELTVYNQVSDRSDNSNQLMSDWFSTDHWPPLASKGLNPVIDVEDLSMVLMRMESGVYASYQQCHYTPDYWRNYTVIGTQGRLENFGDGQGGTIRLWNSRCDYSPQGDASFPILGDEQGHGDADVLTIGEFFRFVRTGAPTDTSPLGAWYAVAAGIQAANSLRHGSQPQHVPELPRELITYFHNNQRKA